MKTYVIPQPVAQALIDYLKTRPYVEVHELIGALLQLQDAPES